MDLRLGLISKDRGEDPLGSGGRELNGRSIAPSYINTVCLPGENFEIKGNCWVASWGDETGNLERQREVDLPILSTYVKHIKFQFRVYFLAPIGAQGATMSVCLSVCLSVRHKLV